MAWYRFWKKSGPMALLTEKYVWLNIKDYPNEEGVKAESEDWADRMPGGHNSHYSYGFEEVSHPPISELKKMIKYAKEDIGDRRRHLRLLEDTLRKVSTR